MFSLFNLINRLANPTRSERRAAARRCQSTKLGLQKLESREVPSSTLTWTGLGDVASKTNPNPNADWSNSLNWTGGSSGAIPANGDTLIFESSPKSTTSMNDLSGLSIKNIVIEGANYNISGDSINLSAGILANNSSGVNVVDLGINMSAAQTMNASTAGDLVLDGTINNDGYNLSAYAGGVVSFEGAISGAGDFIMNGPNKVNLGATNSFTGTTYENTGTMYLQAANGNAIVGNLVVGDAAQSNEADVVRLSNNNEISNTSNVFITWSGLLDLNGYNDSLGTLTMNGGNVTSGNGLLSVEGPITTQASSYTAIIDANLHLSGTAQVFNISSGTAGTDLNFKGDISGSAGLDKEGAGQLRLSGNNSYSGATLVEAGNLVAATNDSLGSSATTVANGAVLNFINPNTASLSFNANSVTLDGGTLEASGAVTLAGQLILAADSTIEVNSSNTLDLTGVVSGSGNLSKTWAGTLNLDTANNYSGFTTVTNGVLALYNSQALGDTSGVKVGATGTLALENGVNISPIALTLNSTGNTDGALYSNGSSTWQGTINLTGASNIDVATGGVLTLSGAIGGGSANSLTIGDSTGDPHADGTVMMTSSNTYAGGTTVSEGILEITNADALGKVSGNVTVVTGATLEVSGGISFAANSLYLNGSGYSNSGALVNANGDNLWTGTVNLSNTSTIATDGGTQLDITGVVNGSNSSNLLTTGRGTLILSGTNNFEGYCKILEGIVEASNAQALGGAPLNGGAGTTVENGATLQLEGFSYVIEPLTLYGNGANGSQGALEAANGASKWAGPIVINSSASITADANASLNDGIQIANHGFNLSIGGAGNITLNSALSGSGGLIMNGTGILTLGGADSNSYSGATVVNSGTLVVNKAATLNSISGSGLTINAGATAEGAGTIDCNVSVNSGGMLYLSGTIDGNVTNSGIVDPAGQGAVGTMTINGNYTQNSGGTLDLEIAGAKSFDELNISKNASFAGTIDVSLLNNYNPLSGTDFQLITFNSSSGKFGTVNLPQGWTIEYNSKNVTVVS
jgi:autotransporter-associated beta strand protein